MYSWDDYQDPPSILLNVAGRNRFLRACWGNLVGNSVEHNMGLHVPLGWFIEFALIFLFLHGSFLTHLVFMFLYLVYLVYLPLILFNSTQLLYSLPPPPFSSFLHSQSWSCVTSSLPTQLPWQRLTILNNLGHSTHTYRTACPVPTFSACRHVIV